MLDARILITGDAELPENIAEELALAPGEEVLFTSKLFLEDDVPVILANNYLPMRLIAEPYTTEDLTRPIYDFMETLSHRRLAYYLSEITPITVGKALADALRIAPGAPLIAFDEIGYDDDNEPILKAVSYFRDDLLRFRILRRRV